MIRSQALACSLLASGASRVLVGGYCPKIALIDVAYFLAVRGPLEAARGVRHIHSFGFY